MQQQTTPATFGAAIAYWRGRGYPDAEAQRLAWGAAASDWHRQRWRPTATDFCAGCQLPVASDDALILSNGERIHTSQAQACIVAYGLRWQGEAASALAAIGIPAPGEIADPSAAAAA
jgi:hypothetical protein